MDVLIKTGLKTPNDELSRAFEIAQSNYGGHLAQLKKLIPPFEAFYNSQSDEQKKVTDTLFRTGKYEKKHKGK